jgi:hypothetical protein
MDVGICSPNPVGASSASERMYQSLHQRLRVRFRGQSAPAQREAQASRSAFEK